MAWKQYFPILPFPFGRGSSVQTFTPPATMYEPSIDINERRGYAIGLFRHYKGALTGKNVYQLIDDTITTQQPSDASRIKKIFFAGHVNEVTTAEQALLEAAGYTMDGS